MQLSRSAKASISFLVATLIIMVFDVVQMNAHMEWEHALPMWLSHAMHTLENVAMPPIIAFGGYAMYLVWTGSRAGYVIIMLISVANVALNLPTTFWRIEAGFLQGGVVCGVEAFIGIAALYYSFIGVRETPNEPAHAKVAA